MDTKGKGLMDFKDNQWNLKLLYTCY